MTPENPDELNRWLDDLANGVTPFDEDLDPDLLATARWFHDVGAEPLPTPAFRTRLENELMDHLVLAPTAGRLAGAPHHSPSDHGSGHRSTPAYLPTRSPWCQSTSTRVAAALLLVAVGLAYLALGPLRSDPDPPRPIPAAIAPVATPGTPLASPTAAPFPLADHLIIGMWQFDIETRQPGIDLAYYYFAEDGTFVGTGERGDYVHVGNWRAIGARTVELVSVLQEIPDQRTFDPDYVPVANDLGPAILSVRLTLEIDATGNTVTADGEGTMYDEDGSVANTFDGPNAHSVGTRMELMPTAPTPSPTS